MRPSRWIIAGAAVVTLTGLGWQITAPMRVNDAPGPMADLTQTADAWLIPGRGGNTDQLKPLADALEQQGVTVRIVNIGDGTGPVDSYGERLASAVTANSRPVDLVGYSAGGIIARKAAQLDGSNIRRIVTVASPHNGTALANLGRLAGCDPMCQDLATDSPLLESLNHDVSEQRWLTIWSSSDEVIRPADSATIDGATEVNYQQQCNRDISHGEIIQDRAVTSWITQWLTRGTTDARC